jgi:hypothetical protein
MDATIIEAQLPIAKFSKESYKERNAYGISGLKHSHVTDTVTLFFDLRLRNTATATVLIYAICSTLCAMLLHGVDLIPVTRRIPNYRSLTPGSFIERVT